MPGHIKKSVGPDPDPDPWLRVGDELKAKLKAKPYDPKKSCWVPDKSTGGYLEGLIDSSEGEKVTVTILETKDVSANMTFLLRYFHGLNILCRKRYSRRIKSARLILPSLTAVRTCLV